MMQCDSKRKVSAQEKITREWDGLAGEWDDLASGYVRDVYRLLLDQSLLKYAQNGQILDFGCGTGLLTDKLRIHASKILAIDASSQMIRVLQEKMRSDEWENVTAVVAVLAQVDSAGDETIKRAFAEFENSIDLVVASSVMTFLPDEDLEATMRAIGRFLRPGGVFCHTDWPQSDDKHPEGMNNEKAEKIYAMADLKMQSMNIFPIRSGGDDCKCFFGIARKE
jgi:predicted TPR repeat methyltransferase